MVIIFLVLDSNSEASRGVLHVMFQNLEVFERWHILFLFIT